MTSYSVATLVTAASATQILNIGLEVAKALGLPVTSWRADDVSRAMLKFSARVLSVVDATASSLARSAFLSTATGDWLRIKALEDYGVEPQEATFAASTLTLSNTGVATYVIDAGDLTAKNSSTGVTYTSTTESVTIAAGQTVEIEVTSNTEGSDGSAAEDEIDELVTTYLGVSIVGSTAAVGRDRISDEALREICRDSLGALSPNGPSDAYRYVALNSTLTGSLEPTKAAVVDDSDEGEVTVYVAGDAGPVSSGALASVTQAIASWATPLCITPTVLNATAQEVDGTYTASGLDLPLDLESVVSDAHLGVVAAADIGGSITRSALITAVHQALVATGASRVSVTLVSPATDVILAAGTVGTLGDISATEV